MGWWGRELIRKQNEVNKNWKKETGNAGEKSTSTLESVKNKIIYGGKPKAEKRVIELTGISKYAGRYSRKAYG